MTVYRLLRVVELMPGGSARPHEAVRNSSTSPPSGNQVDGSPLESHLYRTVVNGRHPGPAKIHDNGRHFDVFSDLSYQELLVCYIQIIYIILKFDFV